MTVSAVIALLWFLGCTVAVVTWTRTLWRAINARRRHRAAGENGSLLLLASERIRRSSFALAQAWAALLVIPAAFVVDDPLLRMALARGLLLLVSVLMAAHGLQADWGDTRIQTLIRAENAAAQTMDG